MDNEEVKACACLMCFFPAAEGSKWCKYHRNIEEQWERKLATFRANTRKGE